MSKIQEVVIIVELWEGDHSLLIRREVSILVDPYDKINQTKLTDAAQRGVANVLDSLKNNLENQ